MIKEICFIKKVRDLFNNKMDYDQKKYFYEIQNFNNLKMLMHHY